MKVLSEGHPSPPLAKEPECTRSQLLGYFDSANTEVARAHRYLRPDNTTGLSGLPDPKLVVDAGVLYYLDKS